MTDVEALEDRGNTEEVTIDEDVPIFTDDDCVNEVCAAKAAEVEVVEPEIVVVVDAVWEDVVAVCRIGDTWMMFDEDVETLEA